MNKVIFYCLCLTVLLNSCKKSVRLGDSHKLQEGKIFYLKTQHGLPYAKSLEIVGADISSFSASIDGLSEYSKDKNYVYFRESRINGAEPTSFTIIKGGPYSKDHKNVYIQLQTRNDYKISKLPNADAGTFELIVSKSSHHYAKDKRAVYMNGAEIFGADRASFIVLPENMSYGKDSAHVFYHGKKVAYDRATFKILPRKVNAKASSFPSHYVKDKNGVYFMGQKISGADPETYRFIGDMRLYAKDASNVFYQEKLLAGADARAFEILKNPSTNRETAWASDQSNVYYEATKALEVNINTFELLSNTYAKDSRRVYYKGRIVPNADPNTFKKTKPTGYWRDKKMRFKDGMPVEMREEN